MTLRRILNEYHINSCCSYCIYLKSGIASAQLLLLGNMFKEVRRPCWSSGRSCSRPGEVCPITHILLLSLIPPTHTHTNTHTHKHRNTHRHSLTHSHSLPLFLYHSLTHTHTLTHTYLKQLCLVGSALCKSVVSSLASQT